MPALTACRVLGPGGWTGPVTIEIDDAGLVTALDDASLDSSTAAHGTLVPGFVDVQVNGIDDVDCFHASGQDWSRLSELLLDQGVTSWCPTLVTHALVELAAPLQRIAAAQRDAAGSDDCAGIIGAHLEGPFLGDAPGAHRRDLLAPIDIDWLTALPDVVKLVTLAPELDHAAEAISLLAARGVTVSLGHSRPSLADVAAAVTAGATMVTHVFNAMSGVHHRSPGLASLALVDDRLAVGLIADLIHVDPAAVQLTFRAKPADLIFLVTDAVAWRASGTGIAMRDGAPRLEDGTLAGSSLTMDQAVRNVVHVCGIGLDRAIRAASTNPARLMGCSDRGEIAVGRRADLVALDDDLRIAGVWLCGRQVR